MRDFHQKLYRPELMTELDWEELPEESKLLAWSIFRDRHVKKLRKFFAHTYLMNEETCSKMFATLTSADLAIFLFESDLNVSHINEPADWRIFVS